MEKGLIGDCFCGAGGASLGIEEAFGRTVDFAINHDMTAIRLHSRNHPGTYHMTEDIFTTSVEKYVAGRKVALLWASPDCTHFSKAKGKTPRKQGIRMLPFAVYFHAAQIHPEVICMENLIPNLTVRENVEVGAYLSDQPLDVDELLHTLGIYEHQRKLPNQLSGGQQQRCAIGRAIVKNPDILLCDEPTGALDYNTSKEILRLIETVNQKYGNTIVMVTHNDAIKDMADRVVKLRDGMIRKNYRNEHKVSADELDW